MTPCDCRYDEAMGAIIFCSLHAAAGELLEACQRFAPVLRWLEAHDDGTAGYSVAKQLRPFMDAAIAKAKNR